MSEPKIFQVGGALLRFRSMLAEVGLSGEVGLILSERDISILDELSVGANHWKGQLQGWTGKPRNLAGSPIKSGEAIDHAETARKELFELLHNADGKYQV